MKHTIVILFLFFNGYIFAQSETDFSKVSVKTDADCKTAEPKVIEAANLVIANSLHIDNKSVFAARSFIITWMSATPDFTFGLDDKITKLSDDKNILLMGVFMACEAKFALENRDKSKDEKEVLKGSYSMLAEYCANEKNEVEQSKAVKKLLEAYKADKMKEYVK
jgi:hypothetical protein